MNGGARDHVWRDRCHYTPNIQMRKLRLGGVSPQAKVSVKTEASWWGSETALVVGRAVGNLVLCSCYQEVKSPWERKTPKP